ncbi:MAG TPA: putative glycoside hydrolase [Solirubrobacteraceae bacterium]|nr:putative glycoside hydrolase [Solirubrobacteraceae bacterium]
MPGRTRACLLAALTMLCAALPTGAASAGPAEAGGVKFFKRTDSSFDGYTTAAAPDFQAWMREKFFRAEVWSPYFDDKTAWYPQGLASRNLYAIYREDAATVAAHPEWVLRDAGGAPLYIPWGCSGGVCPQYAGDVGSRSFRRAWIKRARAVLAHGYRGLWIDDVNLEFRVGDGEGRWRAPMDPRTGREMTWENWRRYVAEFVEEIRAAFPKAELLHNAIWFAVQPVRSGDPYVRRQIAAADRVNLERGVNDAGLTGGTGQWSLHAFLDHVDAVHEAGRTVVLDAFDDTAAGREYNLAAYFLVSRGGDGVGLASMTPETWWTMYDAELGAPLGARASWSGLLRRDFERGIVLVNEPGAPQRTVDLGEALLDSSGRTVSSVTLDGGRGAVLRRAAPASTAVRTQTVLAEPAARLRTRASTSTARKDTPGVPARESRRASRVLIRGHVRGAGSGSVHVRIERIGARRARTFRRATTALGSRGAFRLELRALPPGRYRIGARYLGSTAGRPSSARPRELRLR